MTLILNEKLTAQEVNSLIDKIQPAPKLFDAKKYFNKAVIEGEPLAIQQEMRNE